jgi:hypothetical protein
MLNLVAETIRRSYENGDRLIANVKKIFVKAPLRVEVYKKRVKEVPLPPEPVFGGADSPASKRFIGGPSHYELSYSALP